MSVVPMQPDQDNRQAKKEHGRSIELYRLIPNLITLTAMAAGLTGIQHAIDGDWDKAVIAIVIAVILDGLDGMTARRLNVASDFGANLDTLSDFLSFGIAPAIILYTWILDAAGRVGWIAMIFYTSAIALRLARFNVESKILPQWHKGFFSGVPSPAGAGLAMLPMILWFHHPEFFKQFAFASPLVGLWTIVVAGLMVSRIPTFSIKTIKVPAKRGMTVLAAAALFLAALASMPWTALTAIDIAYLISIPFAVLRFRALKETYSEDGDSLIVDTDIEAH